jgi:hypothetical protein
MNNRDLIKQYVDTGIKIPEYQVMQLSGADKKTYLRKRLIATNTSNNPFSLMPYEIDLMDSEDRDKYYEKLFAENLTHNTISSFRQMDKFFFGLSDELKSKYLDTVINKGLYLPSYYFNDLPFTDKLKFLKWNASLPLSRYTIHEFFKYLIDELKIYYIKKLIKYHGKDILNHDSIRWKISHHNDKIYLDFLNIIKKYNLIKDEQ